MKSSEAYNKIICEVNCKYGAPMGRGGKGTKPTDKRIFDRKVPLIYDGAYDKGGAYWGSPDNLRVKYTSDLEYIHFYRTY